MQEAFGKHRKRKKQCEPCVHYIKEDKTLLEHKDVTAIIEIGESKWYMYMILWL